eukprot:3932592-Rhodomonas_salina.2
MGQPQYDAAYWQYWGPSYYQSYAPDEEQYDEEYESGRETPRMGREEVCAQDETEGAWCLRTWAMLQWTGPYARSERRCAPKSHAARGTHISCPSHGIGCLREATACCV